MNLFNERAEFFTLEDDTFSNRQYAWAYKIEPALSRIGHRCDACGNGYIYPGPYPDRPLSVILERPGKYPDLLGCGAYPLLIVSERVVDTWLSASIQGFLAYPMSVKTESPIHRHSLPNYYHIQITGRCELDTEAMGIKVLYCCPTCMYRQIEPTTEFDFSPLNDTWDKSELFSSDLFPMVTFCTRRILKLSQQHQWTNFRFERSMSI